MLNTTIRHLQLHNRKILVCLEDKKYNKNSEIKFLPACIESMEYVDENYVICMDILGEYGVYKIEESNKL